MLLSQTLSTVLGQVDVALEVLIVDDASDDETASLVVGSEDSRVRILRHRSRLGVAAARNTGLAQARAPWVAFTDDDDLWAPHKLATQLEALRHSNGRGWCQVGTVKVRNDLTIVEAEIREDDGSNFYRDLLQRNVVPGGGSGVMASTTLAREIGGFDAQLPAGQDWDLWIRLASAAPVTTVCRPLVAYRRHAGSMSCNADRLRLTTNLIGEKYRREREALGVETLDSPFEIYQGEAYLRAGRQFAATRHYLKLAIRWRNARWVAHAGASMVGLPLQDWRDRRMAARIPAWWVEEAEEWLGPLRAAQALAPPS
jgi:glycosyltransferase involved in cell wall biosynthesis